MGLIVTVCASLMVIAPRPPAAEAATVTPPCHVTDIRATPAAPGSNRFVLTWTPGCDGGDPDTRFTYSVESYDLDLGLTGYLSEPGATSLTTYPLPCGHWYGFTVTAINSQGTTGWGTGPNAVHVPICAPSAVSSLRVDYWGAHAATVKWTPPTWDGGSSISNYIVELSSDYGQTWNQVAILPGSSSGYTMHDLDWYTFYRVRVTPISSGWPEPGPSSTVPFIVYGSPTVPGDVALDSNGTDGRVRATWTASDGSGLALRDYEYQYASNYSTDGGFSGDFHTGLFDFQATAGELPDVRPGQTIYFQMRSKSDLRVSWWSPIVVHTRPPIIPEAVENLALQRADQSIQVTWDAPAYDGGGEITGYRVQYADVFGTWSTLDVPATPRSASITGLVNGASYNLRVAARNAAGQGPWAIGGPATPAGPPCSPTGSVSPSLSSDVASFRLVFQAGCDNGSPVTGYKIWYSTDAAMTNPTERFAAGSRLDTVIGGLDWTKRYHFQVFAVSDAGTSAPMSISSLAVARYPAAPSNVAAAGAFRRANVTWTPADGYGLSVTDYLVRYSSDNGRTWTVFPDGISSTPRATVTGLAEGVTYRIQVMARNALGFGSWSETQVTVPKLPCAPSLQVTPRPASWGGDFQVAITNNCDGGAPIRGYRVLQSASPSMTDPVVSLFDTRDPSLGARTTVAVNPIRVGAPSYFQVVAINDNGMSDPGPQTPVGSRVAVSPSSPPTLTSAVGGRGLGSDGKGTATINWTAPTQTGGGVIDSYEISSSVNGGTTWSVNANVAGSVTTATVGGLTTGITHLFRVRARNAGGWSSYSSTLWAFPVGQPCVPRMTLTSTAAGMQTSFTFTPIAGCTNGAAITSYAIRWWPQSDPGQMSVRSYNVSSPMVADGFEYGTSYMFQISATNAVGQSGWSGTQSVVSAISTPSAPTGLQAVRGDRQVTLSWSAPALTFGSPVSDYLIFVSSDDGVTWSRFNDAVSPATTATVVGLANGKSYRFWVQARNNAGASPASGQASATPAGVPCAPAGVRAATNAASGTITVSWTAGCSNGEAVTGYLVAISDNAQMKGAQVVMVAPSSLSTVVADAPRMSPRYVQVQARNVIGVSISAPSNPVVVTVPPAVPSAPGNLVAQGQAGRVKLTFDAPKSDGGSPIDDYRAEWSLDGVTWTRFADGVSGDRAITVTGLRNGAWYNFRVQARNAAGWGDVSLQTFAMPVSVPCAATGVKGVARSGVVTLSWVAACDGGIGPVYYLVYRSETADMANPAFVGATTDLSLALSNMPKGAKSYYSVQTSNPAGYGPFSAVVSAYLDRSVPDAPQSVTVSSDGVGLDGSARAVVSWVAPADDGGSAIDSYRVELSDNGGVSWVVPTGATLSSTSLRIGALAVNTTYLVRVSARNQLGWGPASMSSSFVAGAVPCAPTGLQVSSGMGMMLNASWTAPGCAGSSAIVAYQFRMSQSASMTNPMFFSTYGVSTSAMVYSMLPKPFYIQVRAVNASGGGAWSDAIQVVN